MLRIAGLLIAGIFMLTTGCKKLDQYPVEPVIEFKSLTTQKDAAGFDIGGMVVVSFTDGDGDIGYRNRGENGSPYDDTASIYFNNFNIKVSEKINGIWTPVVVDLNGRMPYLTPEGSNKALKGDIAMDLFLPRHKSNDTIHFDIFIFDRALHKSNTITTSDIIITTH